MDVQDGFIVGIFNYCDRWCEQCAFTSHCRLFADQARQEAAPDPGLLPPAFDAVPSGHHVLERRATEYEMRTWYWLSGPRRQPRGASQAHDVIAWFHTLIPVKVNRALTVWPQEPASSDNVGSAKVALIGIDRSHAAWLELVERGDVPMSEAAPFIADLVWLGEALERVYPEARAFVRPGLDEPAAVAQYLAIEKEPL